MDKKVLAKRGILLIAIFAIMSIENSYSRHPSLDTLDWWIEVNDGLGKCAYNFGEAGSELRWDKDDFDITNRAHRKGLMYVNVDYGQGHVDETDPGGCKDGWFYHDTIDNKWYRVADNAPQGYYSARKVLYNGNDIFEINNGMVYQMTFDYENYPTGWKTISKSPHAPLNDSHLSDAMNTGSDCFINSALPGMAEASAAIGDTIYFLFGTRIVSGNCDGSNPGDDNPFVAKMNIHDGIWIFEELPEFPYGNDFFDMQITDAIAGKYRYYIKYFNYPRFPRPNTDGMNVDWWFKKFRNDDNFDIQEETDSPFYMKGEVLKANKIYDGETSNGDIIEIKGYDEPNPSDLYDTYKTYYMAKNLTTGDTLGWAGFYCGSSSNVHPDFIPHNFWVYEPENHTWRMAGRGPDYCNFTGSGATGMGATGVSWDKSKIMGKTQRGTYEWRGTGWHYLNDRTKGFGVISTNGIVYMGGSHSGSLGGGGKNIERFVNANFMIMGPLDDPHNVCLNETYNTHYRNLSSPDDGKSIYGFLYEKDMHCYDGVEPEYQSDDGRAYYGVYYYRFNEDKVQSTRNLHVEAATYVGGSSGSLGNKAINVGVGDGYKLYMAGNYSGVEAQNAGHFHSSYNEKNLNGADSDSRGKIIVLNKFADTIMQTINLGNEIYCYEMQNWPPFRMAVAGDWGVSVLDSSGNELWTRPASDFGGSGHLEVDIDDIGNVAVLNTDGSYRFYVVEPDGSALKNPGGNTTNAPTTVGVEGDYYNTASGFLNAVAIKNDTVFVGGFNNDHLDGEAVCGENSSLPVQAAFLRAFAWDGGSSDYKFIWRTWDVRGEYLGLDQADERVYQINVGKDGKLYSASFSHNANGVMRWNGKTSVEIEAKKTGECDQGSNNGTNTTVSIDKYSALWGFCDDKDVTQFCTIDPKTGYVERSMFISSIESNGCKNSFMVKKGYIHADAKGFVYIAAQSAARYQNREVQYINGKLIGNYAGGDGVIGIISPDYNAVTFMGAFPDSIAPSSMCGVGIRDNWIAMVGNSEKGKMITGATKVTDPTYGTTKFKKEWALNPEPLNLGYSTKDGGDIGEYDVSDAFLAVWYQDVWNYSQDTLEDNIMPGDTIVPPEFFNCGADFRIKEIPVPDAIEDPAQTKIDVCTDQIVTFEDLSECAVEWQWDFGEGARVGPNFVNTQASGEGPWNVKYLTPGEKTVRLDIKIMTVDVDGNPHYKWTYKEIPNYVNVIDNNLELSEIDGATEFCSGTETFFEVESVYGIKEMVWSVPAGSEILDGQGDRKIRVKIGDQSGNVTVKGVLPCGQETPEKILPVTVSSPDENTVLFVVGDDKIIVDNDTPGYGKSKVWSDPDGLTWSDVIKDESLGSTNYGYHGSNYHYYAFENAKFGWNLEYSPDIPEAGYYEVYMKYPFISGVGNESHNPNIPVNILHNSGTFTTHIDQEQTGGYWKKLGVFEFTSGSDIAAKVYLSDKKMKYWADAFAWKKAGPVSLSKGDSAILDHLTNSLGKNVIIKTDEEVRTSDAGCASAMIISNTTDEIYIENKFRDVKIPIICHNPNMYPYIGLSFSGGNKGIEGGNTQVSITNNAHELAGGYSGDVTVYSNTDNGMTWGTPSDPSLTVASIKGDASKAVIFGYDDECPLEGGVTEAPERRVAFFLDNNGATSLTADGWQLFDQAVCWSFGNCANLSGSNDINITSYDFDICPGDEMAVTFNANGVYGLDNGSSCNAENEFKMVLSDHLGNFTSDPIVLADTTTASSGTYTLKGILPMDLISGQYRIRIRSSNPSTASDPTSTPISVGDYPEDAGEITGPETFCIGEEAIGTYSVPNTGSLYEWEIPLAARFVPDTLSPPVKDVLYTTSNEVTVDFKESTDKFVKVKLKDGCGWSLDPSKINVKRDGTPPGPDLPDKVGGQEVICPDGEYDYTVPLIDYADTYSWDVDPSLGTKIEEDDNRLTIKASSTDGNTGQVRLIASNSCGSTPVITLDVEINKSANLPDITGGITVNETGCDGQYNFEIAPVNDASSYDWTFSPNDANVLSPTPLLNNVDVMFNSGGSFDVTAHATNGCGTSTKTTTVNVAGSGKRAVLIVRDPSSLESDDSQIKSRLESLGFFVDVKDSDYNPGIEVNCNQLIVFSPTSPNEPDNDDKIISSRFADMGVPMVVCNEKYVVGGTRAGITAALNMTDKNYYKGTQYTSKLKDKTDIDIVSTCHPITETSTSGVNTVFTGQNNMAYGIPPSSARVLAYAQDATEGEAALFVYETGDDMFNGKAPARRVSVFIGINSANSVNSTGWELFDRSVQWAAGDLGKKELTFNSISQTSICPGNTLNVNYEIDDPGYSVSKDIEVRLSNKFGSFDTYDLIGSVNTSNSGTINSSIPGSKDSSDLYKLRLYVPDCNMFIEYPENLTINNCVSCPDSLITNDTVVDVLCKGDASGSIDITTGNGTAPYSFNWSNSSPLEDVENLTAGEYYVTVTDDNLCSYIDTFIVNETATELLINNSTITDVDCKGDTTGEISITASGGTVSSDYDYAWDNSDTTSVITGLSADNYSVTVSDDNGCTTTGVYLIDEPTNGININLDNLTDVKCKGDTSGSISITASGGTVSGAYDYSWDNGETDEDLTNIGAGTYELTVTDDHSCSSVESYTVNEPANALSISVTSNDPTSFGGNDGEINVTPSGGIPGYTYSWTTSDGAGISAGAQNQTTLEAGTYELIVSDNNLCEVFDTITLYEPGQLKIVDTIINNLVCNGDGDGSIEIHVTGGTRPYDTDSTSWSFDGDSTFSINALSGGTYTITVKDNFGNTITQSYGVAEPTAVSVALDTLVDVLCKGDTSGAIKITASGGTVSGAYDYSWDNGETDEDLTNIGAGTYELTVTDDHSCSSVEFYTVNEPANALSISVTSNDPTSFGGNDGEINVTPSGGIPGYTYSWTTSDGAGISAGAQNQTTLEAGTYELIVSDNNLCEVFDTVTLDQPGEFKVIDTTFTHVSCYGESDGVITAKITGGERPFVTPAGWNIGSADSIFTINNLLAGDVNVTFEDNNGNTVSQVYRVNQPDSITVTADSITNVDCHSNSTGEIFIDVQGGTPGYDFVWSGLGTDSNVVSLPAGTYDVKVSDNNSCTQTASFTVTQPDSISLSGTVTEPSGFGTDDGNIDLEVTGGTSPYNYVWDSGYVTQDISNIGGGLYNVEITDNNGCQRDTTFAVNEPSDIDVSDTISNVTCHGGSDGRIAIHVSGGSKPYNMPAEWTTMTDSTFERTGLSSGTYNLNFTDDNGIPKLASFTVSEPDTISVNAVVSDLNCKNDGSGEIDLSVTGGTVSGDYNYQWSNSQTTSLITALDSNSYTVTVSDDNGCSVVSSYLVGEPDSLQVLTDSIVDASCKDYSDAGIYLTAQGGTPSYTFAWGGGENDTDLTGITAGTYNLTVSDSKGCSTQESYTVNEPAGMSVSLDTVIDATCYGTRDGQVGIDVTGGTTPYDFEWSNDSTSEDIISVPADTYLVTVTDNKGCSKIESYTVNQPAEMVVDFTTSTGDTVICKGSNMEITATTPGGEDYNWSNSDTTQSITVNNTTTTKYIVTITDSSGICSAVDSVTIIAVPGAVTNLQDETAKCGNSDSVRITGASNSTYDYLWNTGETSQSINAGLGMYMVTVTNTYGCSSYDTTQIVDYTAVPANITNSDSTVCSGGDIDLTASDAGVSQFRWSNDSTGSTVTISNVTIQQQYGLTITDNNGCTSTDEITVLVDTLPGAVIEGDQQMYTNCSETYSVKDADFINYTYEFSAPGADITDNGTGEADISWYSDGSKTINLTVTDNNTDCSSQKVYNVEVKPAPAIDAPDAVTASCYNSDSVALDFSIVDVFKTYQVYVNDFSLGGGNSAKSYSANVSTGMDATIKLDAGVGCAEQIQLVIVEMPSEPTVSLTNSTTQLCANDKGELSVTYTPSTANVSWVNYNGASQSTISSLDTGMYKVRVSTSQDCFIEDSFEISYYDNTLDFEIETEDAYCHKASDGEVRLVPITGQIIDAEWYSEITGNKLGFGDVSGITGLRAGKYYVRVISINDCEFTKEIEIANENASCINIPTAFTPNGDGVHDYWVIEKLYTFYPNATVNVYNRIGERVFSNEGSKEPWDGTMNGVPVPVSTYHYIIDLNDGSAPLTGQITILR